MAYRNVGEAVPRATRPRARGETKRAALRINSAAMVVGQADGFSALGVATALLLGLLARRRGGAGPGAATRRCSSPWPTCCPRTCSSTRGGLPDRGTDAGQYGINARYRLYETAEGWVFLAAGAPGEWAGLATALAPYVDLAADPRFADADARRAHDDDLAAILAGVFAGRSAREWEDDLLAQDVGCVAVRESAPEAQLFGADGIGREQGWITEVEHPVHGTHPPPHAVDPVLALGAPW